MVECYFAKVWQDGKRTSEFYADFDNVYRKPTKIFTLQVMMFQILIYQTMYLLNIVR